jgi:inhibitor of cysteine peptidase
MNTDKNTWRNRLAMRLPCGLLLAVLALTAYGKSDAPDSPRRIRTHSQLLHLLKQRTTGHLQSGTRNAADSATVGGLSLSSGLSHSETNVQVQGVDEADIVKTGDDGYIYHIRSGQVRIIKGFPLNEIKLEKTLDFSEQNFYPSGLYLAGHRLVILGGAWKAAPRSDRGLAVDSWQGGFTETRALVYNVDNPAQPKLERELSIEGSYLDSRGIGNNLYLMARSYPRYYLLGQAVRNKTAARKPANLLPAVSDVTQAKTKRNRLKLRNVYYLPDFVEPDYVVIAGFPLDRPEQPADIKAYLGAGELVYASAHNLYLSASRYPFVNFGLSASGAEANPNQNREITQVFKFALDDGTTRFLAAGEVPGTVLNQFSMDEQGNYFRIATTTHDWASGSNASHNDLYVLDKNLAVAGSLKNLAAGEQIYAARFMGNRCYLVTFRTMDPLFAIDLSRPEQPTVLGELKIPGYSNYLHPFDETHILGFGKEAKVVENSANNADETWPGAGAFYQGMKLSLFDVGDVAQPKELYTVGIGDRGTDSELLHNHKALFQDPARHLFGFPIEVAEIPGKTDQTPAWEYGQTVFQGAYVYEITLDKGIIRKAAVSHLEEGEQPSWERSDFFIQRLFGIESGLYTLSDSLLKVHDFETFSEQARLPLPSAPNTTDTPIPFTDRAM